MNKDEQLRKMRRAFEDVIWMAVRYADGRHTYAPSMVRDAIKEVKEVFPDFKLKDDGVIEKPKEIDWVGAPSDYLWDLFEEDRKAVEDDV